MWPLPGYQAFFSGCLPPSRRPAARRTESVEEGRSGGRESEVSRNQRRTRRSCVQPPRGAGCVKREITFFLLRNLQPLICSFRPAPSTFHAHKLIFFHFYPPLIPRLPCKRWMPPLNYQKLCVLIKKYWVLDGFLTERRAFLVEWVMNKPLRCLTFESLAPFKWPEKSLNVRNTEKKGKRILFSIPCLFFFLFFYPKGLLAVNGVLCGAILAISPPPIF